MLVEKGQAAVEVDIPFLHAADGFLIWSKGFRRAGVFANPAVEAEVIDSEIACSGRREGRVGEDCGEAEGGPWNHRLFLRIGDACPDPVLEIHG